MEIGTLGKVQVKPKEYLLNKLGNKKTSDIIYADIKWSMVNPGKADY